LNWVKTTKAQCQDIQSAEQKPTTIEDKPEPDNKNNLLICVAFVALVAVVFLSKN
jgi:hypothetical protein